MEADKKDFLYGDMFCSKRFIHREWQKEIGKIIAHHLDVVSVIDFGCCVGSFLEGFLETGAMIKGFDVCYEYSKKYTPLNVKPYIEYGDVTKPIFSVMVDCVLCVEVAEHIEPEGTNQFIENLVSHSLNYIILSAAPLGQEGVGHINCKPYEFWKEKLKKRGFDYQKNTTQELIDKILLVKGTTKWIRKNLMVFKKI